MKNKELKFFITIVATSFGCLIVSIGSVVFNLHIRDISESGIFYDNGIGLLLAFLSCVCSGSTFIYSFLGLFYLQKKNK